MPRASDFATRETGVEFTFKILLDRIYNNYQPREITQAVPAIRLNLTIMDDAIRKYVDCMDTTTEGGLPYMLAILEECVQEIINALLPGPDSMLVAALWVYVPKMLTEAMNELPSDHVFHGVTWFMCDVCNEMAHSIIFADEDSPRLCARCDQPIAPVEVASNPEDLPQATEVRLNPGPRTSRRPSSAWLDDEGEEIEDDYDEDTLDTEDQHGHMETNLRNWDFNILKLYDPKSSVREDKGKRTMYLGVELETRAKDGQLISDLVIDITGTQMPSFVICKSDSTTGYMGFEIVTRPATFDVHKTSWGDFFNWAKDKIHTSGTNLGMHVHVSRSAFTSLQIGKLLKFFNRDSNRDLVDFVAGRGFNEYSNPHASHKVTDAMIFGMRAANMHRYAYVNTANKDTLELRFFKATLCEPLFWARLEFAQSACEFIKKTSLRKLKAEDYVNWVKSPARMRRYPHIHGLLQTEEFIDGHSSINFSEGSIPCV